MCRSKKKKKNKHHSEATKWSLPFNTSLTAYILCHSRDGRYQF